MRVLIDDGRCQGHGRCWSTEPQLFEPKDDLGHSAVLGGEDQPDDPDLGHPSRTGGGRRNRSGRACAGKTTLPTFITEEHFAAVRGL